MSGDSEDPAPGDRAPGDRAPGDDDTIRVQADAGSLASDDTLAVTADVTGSSQASARASAPRIRAGRPTLPPTSPNYPTLTVVDPAHYVMEREIARGGMGRVLVARDRRLGREVAVKEMLVQSGGVARRFEREARITARLQHPSIISVFEAGMWPSGEPFYAMPLVTGRSFDEAVASATSYAQRVAFLPNVLAVADAMAYAHDRHVVHRDLKPRNIVLGDFGETVVLDWGIAKDLGSPDPDSLDGRSSPPAGSAAEGRSGLVDSMARARGGAPPDSAAVTANGETTFGEVLGTPAYMPPEQAEGKAIDERADVYAIGALLYQLLAARAPFIADSQAELLASVVASVPRPLRELAPEAPQELIAIVERAMAREVGDRYRTARDLADDLRRFQTGQLVGAHRYSLRQLLRRWLRRHRTALIATGVAAAVAIGIGVVAVQRVVAAEQTAQDERAIATARQKDADELMQFMLVDVGKRLKQIGKLDLMDTVARRAVDYYDAHGDASSDDDAYLAALARLDLGEVIALRGDVPAALVEYQHARASLDRLVAARPEVGTYAASDVVAQLAIGDLQQNLGQTPAALATFRAPLAAAERRLAAHPTDGDAVHDVIAIHNRIATTLDRQGELPAALAEFRISLALAVQPTTRARTDQADQDERTAHEKVGGLLDRANHDLPGALAEYRAALAISQRHADADPKAPIWLVDLALTHDLIGVTLQEQKDIAGALAEFRTGLAMAQRALAVDPTNTSVQGTRAQLGEKVGIALLAQDDYAGALAEFTACGEIFAELGARDPANLDLMRSQSLIANKLGDVRYKTADYAGALAAYRTGLAMRERMVEKDPTNSQWRRDLFFSHYRVALALDAFKDRPHTVEELRAALAVATVTADAHPDNEQYSRDVAQVHADIGEALRQADDFTGATAEIQRALDIAQRFAASPHPDAEWATLVTKFDQALRAVRTPRPKRTGTKPGDVAPVPAAPAKAPKKP